MEKSNQPPQWKLYQTTSNEKVKERQDKEKHGRPKICIRDYSPTEYEELAFLQPSDFELIFGVTDSSGKWRGSPIVKITNPNNGKSVHRMFRTSDEIHSIRDYVSISYTAIKSIVKSKEEFDSLRYVRISKGNRLYYYLIHPNYAVRISIWLGSISVVLGIISLIIALL